MSLESVITCNCPVCLFVSLCSAVPLYQDYCLQALRDDLHRLNKSVSELIKPQCLRGVQSRLIAQCTSPPLDPPELIPSSPPPHPVRVTPCTLWQQLDEVKASGLLNTLTSREICLQEVWKAPLVHWQRNEQDKCRTFIVLLKCVFLLDIRDIHDVTCWCTAYFSCPGSCNKHVYMSCLPLALILSFLVYRNITRLQFSISWLFTGLK